MVAVLSVLDLVGWAGGALTVVAYVSVSTRRWAPDSRSFQVSNMVGAALLAMASFSRGALPSACLNLVWIGFGAQVLLLAHRRARREEWRREWDVQELTEAAEASEALTGTSR